MQELPIENVADYPRPPALEWSDRSVVVRFGGATIVEAPGAWRVLETHHPPTYYIEPKWFAAGTLRPVSGRRSLCEWKGRASYFDIVSGEQIAAAGAWTYRDPSARFAPIRDHVALYAEPMDDILVDSVRVVPQPGNFYGGWMTPNIQGPVKGAPGTLHW